MKRKLYKVTEKDSILAKNVFLLLTFLSQKPGRNSTIITSYDLDKIENDQLWLYAYRTKDRNNPGNTIAVPNSVFDLQITSIDL